MRVMSVTTNRVVTDAGAWVAGGDAAGPWAHPQTPPSASVARIRGGEGRGIAGSAVWDRLTDVMRIPSWSVVVALLAVGLVLPAASQEVPSGTRSPVTWQAEGLAELPAALARAKKSGRRVLVGLSGGPG